MLDFWRDSTGKTRTSIQIHLPSGNDFYKSISARVSTSQKELVVHFPMSKYMSRSDNAFQTFFLDDKNQRSDSEKQAVLYVMKSHPKCIARITSTSKVVGRGKVEDFKSEQRIPLPHECMHQFAEKVDGDDFFYGMKFVKYPDGSNHMHVELLGKVVDSYCPQELESKPIPQVASAVYGQGATMMETESVVGGATILRNDYVASHVRPRQFKRTCTAPTAADPSAPQPSHDDARREALRVLQIAETQQQQQVLQQQHAFQHALQQQQPVLGHCDDSILSDSADTGPNDATQLHQASSLQQAAGKGGRF